MAVNLKKLYDYVVKAEEQGKILGMVELAMVEKAITERRVAAPNPVTGLYAASQNFDNQVLRDPAAAAKRAIIPVLTELNTTNKIDNGLDTLSQTEVRTVVNSLWNVLAGYVPPVP